MVQFIRDFIASIQLLYSLFRQSESVYSRKFVSTNETIERASNISVVRGSLRVSFSSCYAHSKFINAANVDRITRASQLQITRYENNLITKTIQIIQVKIIEVK